MSSDSCRKGTVMSMKDVKIRRYRPEDDERIIEITRCAWADVTLWKKLEDMYGPTGGKPWWYHKVTPLLALAKADPGRFIVAEQDGKVIGYATYGINEDTKIGQVLDNAVDPDYGGQGVGSAMHKEVLKALKRAGMKLAKVGTCEHQITAQKLYKKHGFREVMREIFFVRSLET